MHARRCMTRQTRFLNSASGPQSAGLNISNSARSFRQASKSTFGRRSPVSKVFRGPQLDFALNFLFGTLKEAVDCDVITDLWIVGSVTMAPSAVALATSPSTAAFSLRLVDRCCFFQIFFFYLCSSAFQDSGPLNVTLVQTHCHYVLVVCHHSNSIIILCNFV